MFVIGFMDRRHKLFVSFMILEPLSIQSNEFTLVALAREIMYQEPRNCG